jgi:hypothetical protein
MINEFKKENSFQKKKAVFSDFILGRCFEGGYPFRSHHPLRHQFHPPYTHHLPAHVWSQALRKGHHFFDNH